MTIAKSVFLAFFTVCSVFFMHSQNDQIVDSLENVLQSSVHDTARLSALQKISFRIVGSNPNKAIEYALQGIKLAKAQSNLLAEAQSYNNLGSGYQSKGEYENAMNAYIKALGIHEQLNNESGCAIVYANIGFIFRQQQNYSKAIAFHRKALGIHQKINENDLAAGCMVNIGNVYYNKGDYDSAIVQYTEALSIYQRLGDKASIATIENNIGAIYFEKKDYEKANEYFLRSYVIREQAQNKYEMATSLNNIGEVFGKLGNYDKAIEYCEKSLKVAKEINARDIMIYNYENLAGLNAFVGKFNEAYRFQLLKSDLKDSVLNVENNKQITELSVKYETEKKEAENRVLRAEGERQKIVSIAVTGGLAFVGIFAFFIFRSYRQKKKANVLLASQNSEILIQKDIIEEKSRIVEEKNKDITDSIKYAKRLQSAILKPQEYLSSCFSDGFVLFKPKDIVSGDFYWFEKFGNHSMVAAADCTGHGVPGAFMSIIGCNLLTQAVNEYAITKPSAILNSVNKGISKVLQQKKDEPSVKDGMDIALCVMDTDRMVLEYAGAYNPLWLVRDGKIIEFKANKFPVGAFVGEEIKQFTNHEIPIIKGDMIYLFSDGYADQFGGPQGKKFKYKALQKLILEICSKPTSVQKEIFDKTFESWRGELEQVDDVLLVGVKI
jgi:serine phosphatase RsbU (regulator of sigma subunit)/tetratricopeptide (TPR) repeat protein